MQGIATQKHTVANAGQGVGDGDGLQGWAQLKRIFANAGHGVGDGDGLQGWATKVFATHCISIDFVLNGRKVVTLILQKTKNGKI